MAEFRLVGKSPPRLDALAKATGKAEYVTDFKLPGMLWGKILRSPLAHGRILHIDASRAKRLPSVRAVITPADCPATKYGQVVADETVLALDKVRYIGEEVAAVAAENEEAAEEALGLISVEYEELPLVSDPEKAMMPETPEIHFGGNIAYRFSYERGNGEQGFKESDLVFTSRFRTQMNHQSYIEPRCCLAVADASQNLTVWGGFQNVFLIRQRLATILGISESKIRVIQPFTGGGFGGKTSSSKAPIAALLAIKSGRAVRMANSRSDEFLAGRPRAPGIIEQKVGVKRDGTLVVRQVRVIADCGAYAGNGPGVAECMAMRAENLYRFRHLKGEGFAVYTNKTPTGACRAFGSSEGAFALETQLDEIAEALGIDPLDLRLKNAIEAGEVTLHGWKVQSCGLKECLKAVAAKAGWRERRSRQKDSQGFGIACGIQVSGIRRGIDFDGSSAFVKIELDGRVTLITGEGDTGQGAWSVLAQVVAEELGARYENIQVYPADTGFAPYCLGSWAARVTVAGGNAVRLAAADAKKQLFGVAADLLEASPADLESKNSLVFVRGVPSRSVSFAEASKAAVYRRGGGPILGCATYDNPTELQDKTVFGNFSPCYSFTAQVARIQVDAETGQVRVTAYTASDDSGTIINPLMAEGQIQGCLSQGFGLVLMEEMVWDRSTLVNGNFSDYRVPAAPDFPAPELVFIKTDEPLGLYGGKSVSEISIVPVPAAVANAVYDAAGVRMRDLPITAEMVLRALRARPEK